MGFINTLASEPTLYPRRLLALFASAALFYGCNGQSTRGPLTAAAESETPLATDRTPAERIPVPLPVNRDGSVDSSDGALNKETDPRDPLAEKTSAATKAQRNSTLAEITLKRAGVAAAQPIFAEALRHDANDLRAQFYVRLFKVSDLVDTLIKAKLETAPTDMQALAQLRSVRHDLSSFVPIADWVNESERGDAEANQSMDTLHIVNWIHSVWNNQMANARAAFIKSAFSLPDPYPFLNRLFDQTSESSQTKKPISQKELSDWWTPLDRAISDLPRFF